MRGDLGSVGQGVGAAAVRGEGDRGLGELLVQVRPGAGCCAAPAPDVAQPQVPTPWASYTCRSGPSTPFPSPASLSRIYPRLTSHCRLRCTKEQIVRRYFG
ncbi:unnamed protein product [Urochloa humidicola]